VPIARGGAVDVGFCGGGLNFGMGGSVRPKPSGGVGGGGNRLRAPCPASPAGGTGVKNGFATAPLASWETVPMGGGVGVPGSGTTGMAAEGDEDPRMLGGGPSGAREGGGGKGPEAPARANGAGAPECPCGMLGGGGSVDAGDACAGAQCDVEGGGTEVPFVTSGSAEIGGADVVTDGGGGGIGKGDDGSGAERGCADDGGGGMERDGGGGTEPALRPGGGGTLRPGGGAEVPGFAAGGVLEKLRGRVSDSKMSSARTTEGRDEPLLVDAARFGAPAGSDGASSIHSANSLDSRPCLAASIKHVSLS
jgi:hypothetical protein